MDEKAKILWDLFIVLPACSVALIGAADAVINKLTAAQKEKAAIIENSRKHYGRY